MGGIFFFLEIIAIKRRGNGIFDGREGKCVYVCVSVMCVMYVDGILTGALNGTRFASGAQIHHQSHGPAASNRTVGALRHCHLCHHWPRILFGSLTQNLLQHRGSQ